MKFLIPAAIGAGAALLMHRSFLNRVEQADFIGEVRDELTKLMVLTTFRGALAGIGAFALFREFRK